MNAGDGANEMKLMLAYVLMITSLLAQLDVSGVRSIVAHIRNVKSASEDGAYPVVSVSLDLSRGKAYANAVRFCSSSGDSGGTLGQFEIDLFSGKTGSPTLADHIIAEEDVIKAARDRLAALADQRITGEEAACLVRHTTSFLQVRAFDSCLETVASGEIGATITVAFVSNCEGTSPRNVLPNAYVDSIRGDIALPESPLLEFDTDFDRLRRALRITHTPLDLTVLQAREIALHVLKSTESGKVAGCSVLEASPSAAAFGDYLFLIRDACAAQGSRVTTAIVVNQRTGVAREPCSGRVYSTDDIRKLRLELGQANGAARRKAVEVVRELCRLPQSR